MRIDTLLEKCIAFLEERVSTLLGNATSLLIVFVSAIGTVLVVLYWGDRQDAKVEQGSFISRDTPSYVLNESSVDDLANRRTTTYAIVGSSECIQNSQGNMAGSINSALAKQDVLFAQVYDFCHQGYDPEEKYRAVVVASYFEPDFIIVTQTLSEAHSLFGKKKELKLSDVRNFNTAVVFTHRASPQVIAEQVLAREFSSYDNRFEHSLAPILAPQRFEIVDAIFTQAEEGDTKPRRIDVLPTGSFPSDAYDSKISFILRSKNPTKHPWEVFELIASTAIEKNIPVLFVITPRLEEGTSALKELKIHPITFRIADALEDRYTRKFSEADKYLKEKYGNVRIWLAYKENLASADDFMDYMHFTNFDWIAERLVEVLDERGFLPDE